MAEFCVKCWNEINNSHEPKSALVLSDELELCEKLRGMEKGYCMLQGATIHKVNFLYH